MRDSEAGTAVPCLGLDLFHLQAALAVPALGPGSGIGHAGELAVHVEQQLTGVGHLDDNVRVTTSDGRRIDCGCWHGDTSISSYTHNRGEARRPHP